jgi:uncharacterized protein (TIGR02996 family)
MTEEDAFLMDILARPEDEAARLIYADWLEDHDDPRAELVRQAFLLRYGPPASAARQAFARQWQEARQAHGWQEYDDLLLTWDQLVTVFRFRLAEVIAWCGGPVPPSSLRTWELEPRTLMGQTWYNEDFDWPQTVQQVALTRRRFLERGGRAPSRLAAHLGGGALVLFDPAVEPLVELFSAGSQDYFDDYNLPAWDTWVMQVPEPSPLAAQPTAGASYLLAWVPQTLKGLPRVTIPVNRRECLAWSREVTSPFLRRLRQAGLQGC